MSEHALLNKGGAVAADGHKTRRAALRALVGASALAVPTISSVARALPDPILIAIERHATALGRHEATWISIDLAANSREVSEAEWDAHDQARKDEDAAFDELIARVPETSAGMRAI